MEDLRDLYQEVILDHNKAPRNFKPVEHPTHSSEGFNPLCGDKIQLTLKVDGGQITDVGFQGSGCAISKASASVMTTLVKGKSVAEVEKMFGQFKELITTGIQNFDLAELGKLAVFGGVREFPARVKCAALSWHTLIAALKHREEPVTTE